MALNTAALTLDGPHAAVDVQALGGMLGPATFRLPDGRTLSPMYRAPWHGETGLHLDDSPLLRYLNGEWLCAPFGPTTPPSDLPLGWATRADGAFDADRGCDHGWTANHPWTLVGRDDSKLHLAIEPPPDHVLARVERVVHLVATHPGVDVVTTLHPRRDATVPVALHPTFAVPAGGVELRPGPCRAIHAYPVAPVPGVTRLHPGGRAATLGALPATDGTTLDLRRLPLPGDTEELLQLEDVQPPFTLRWRQDSSETNRDAAAIDLVLDWDADTLPDLMLWVSQRGRKHAPWNGRNVALGVEPCASCFDLTRVADPASDHPLAKRRGVVLRAGAPLALRWSLRARAVGPDRRP